MTRRILLAAAACLTVFAAGCGGEETPADNAADQKNEAMDDAKDAMDDATDE